jgi:hypothetical protein
MSKKKPVFRAGYVIGLIFLALAWIFSSHDLGLVGSGVMVATMVMPGLKATVDFFRGLNEGVKLELEIQRLRQEQELKALKEL